MVTPDNRRQRAIEASRAYLAREQFGDEIYRGALDSIARRGVTIEPVGDSMQEPALRKLEETAAGIAADAFAYKGLTHGLTWPVGALLAAIEQEQGTSPADMLDKVEESVRKQDTSE